MAFQDEYKIIERIAGSGTVTGADAGEPLPVRYELMIREGVKANPSDPEPPRKMSGTIWSGDEPFLASRLLNRDLTLHLSDGRDWEFRFVHRNGEVASRGATLELSLHQHV